MPFGPGTVSLTLNTTCLNAYASQLTGTGTITANGLVLGGFDLTFDASHGLQQTLALNGQGQNLVIHLDQNGSADLGARRSGSLTIQDGITVECKDGHVRTNGTVNVSGANTTWACGSYLYVAHGKLNITDGAKVTSGREGYIGMGDNSAGTVTISGTDSQWQCNSSLMVGTSSAGRLSVLDGATMKNKNGYIGAGSDGVGTTVVSGQGSTWINDDLYVGRYGMGRLKVLDFGAVASDDAYVGYKPDSIGMVTVSGYHSMWKTDGNLCVGCEGIGILNIDHGGAVCVDGILEIDEDLDGDSFINMSDGGMLILQCNADDSLEQFLQQVGGTDAIRWWDPTIGSWNSLTTATRGVDYTLDYYSMNGSYTRLTVNAAAPVPESSTIVLLLTALVAAGLVPTMKGRKA